MRKLILLPVLAFAAPALAQDVPGQAGEVANAIAACKAITEVDRIHPDRLPAAGWELARRRGARSGVVVHGVYEAESDRVRIVVATEQERERQGHGWEDRERQGFGRPPHSHNNSHRQHVLALM